MQGIKNIIFDLGVVLTGLDSKRCMDAFENIGAHQIADYIKGHRTEDLFYDTEVGNINAAEFCDEVRRITGCTIEDDKIIWAWNELLTGIPDEKKQRLLQLKSNYRVFLLSNTNDMHWKKCADDFFPYKDYCVNDYFEHIFLSYEMHLIKPSEEIFTTALREANLVANETLFIDDTLVNCEAAQRLGINVIHETTGSDWLKELK